MRYITEYTINGARYETEIWAENWPVATNIAMQRGMGEWVIAESTRPAPALTSELVHIGDYHAALHSACWLGMVAIASGVEKGFNLLHDQSLVHTIAHLIDVGDRVRQEDSILRLREIAISEAVRLEKIVPGFRKVVD